MTAYSYTIYVGTCVDGTAVDALNAFSLDEIFITPVATSCHIITSLCRDFQTYSFVCILMKLEC